MPLRECHRLRKGRRRATNRNHRLQTCLRKHGRRPARMAVIRSLRARALSRRWVRVVVIATALVAAVVAASFVVPARWAAQVLPGDSVVDSEAVAYRPGQSSSIVDRITTEGISVFEPQGDILLTTVSIDTDLTVVEWIESSLRDSIELRSRESVFGDRSPAEQREHNQELMQDSKEAAVVVALEHLGVDAVDATGVAFAATVTDGPADGVLRVGEVIVALDARPVTTLRSLLDLLASRPPGTEAVLTLEHSETLDRRDARIVLGPHPDEGNEGGFIGVSRVWERIEHNPLPFDVGIASGSVGGPSAGLAFALGVLDVLTPGELTGGRRIAVTGTIGLDGSVGDVGGVTQKSYAARSAGAELFIVPAAQQEQALTGSGTMQVAGVASLTDALEALAAFGGEVNDLALQGYPPAPASGSPGL